MFDGNYDDEAREAIRAAVYAVFHRRDALERLLGRPLRRDVLPVVISVSPITVNIKGASVGCAAFVAAAAFMASSPPTHMDIGFSGEVSSPRGQNMYVSLSRSWIEDIISAFSLQVTVAGDVLPSVGFESKYARAFENQLRLCVANQSTGYHVLNASSVDDLMEAAFGPIPGTWENTRETVVMG